MDIVVKDFSTAPGGRYKKDGDYSGEEFREGFLEPLFVDAADKETVNIFLDGVEGYPSSFLEEAFGGLARKVKNKEVIKRRLRFITDDSILEREIIGYIENA